MDKKNECNSLDGVVGQSLNIGGHFSLNIFNWCSHKIYMLCCSYEHFGSEQPQKVKHTQKVVNINVLFLAQKILSSIICFMTVDFIQSKTVREL